MWPVPPRMATYTINFFEIGSHRSQHWIWVRFTPRNYVTLIRFLLPAQGGRPLWPVPPRIATILSAGQHQVRNSGLGTVHSMVLRSTDEGSDASTSGSPLLACAAPHGHCTESDSGSWAKQQSALALGTIHYMELCLTEEGTAAGTRGSPLVVCAAPHGHRTKSNFGNGSDHGITSH